MKILGTDKASYIPPLSPPDREMTVQQLREMISRHTVDMLHKQNRVTEAVELNHRYFVMGMI